MSKSSSAPNHSHATDAALDVRPIAPTIGAEIHGVRLSGDLPSETVTAIRDALLRHRVVFFRGQRHLDEAQHQAFARLLGPLVPHPTLPSVAGTEAVLDIDAENSRASQWHTDVTFVPAFPQFSVLRERGHSAGRRRHRVGWTFRSAASMRALAILFCTMDTRFFGVQAYATTNDAMPLRLPRYEMRGRAIEDFYVPLP